MSCEGLRRLLSSAYAHECVASCGRALWLGNWQACCTCSTALALQYAATGPAVSILLLPNLSYRRCECSYEAECLLPAICMPCADVSQNARLLAAYVDKKQEAAQLREALLQQQQESEVRWCPRAAWSVAPV